MKSPHDLLPLPAPSEYDPSENNPAYFYKNIIKPLIPDSLRIMDNYLTLDWGRVEELKEVINTVLKTVSKTLENNELIIKFQEHQYPKKFEEYKVEVSKSMRTIDFYLKDFKADNAIHKTYLINHILKLNGQEAMCKDKWSVKDMKSLYNYLENPQIMKVINKKFLPTDDLPKEAMMNLAKDKMAIWNKVRIDKINNVKKEDLVPPFNPGSGVQKREFFKYLGISPLAFSKTSGEASWGRDQIEEIFHITEDPVLKEVLQMFIDYSYSAIIKNNFLESFDRFAIGDRLYSNLKLFGTKTFRPTGNSPNLLQMPSTGSIYAKPLKRCFIAPEGYLIWTIDYSALEDRVIANLSGDKNKLNIFKEGLDGHSLNACGYFPERIAKILGPNTNNIEYVKLFKAEVDKGNKELKAIRQESKGPTFGLAYGAYPKKIADTIKCSLEEATTIFDNYHNTLYPGITSLRDKILNMAKQDGYVHLGLGCRLYSNDVEKGSRTLFNAVSQFWSILTLLAINKLHQEIDKENREKDIVVTATIYDSIYGVIKNDAESIKWLNDTICTIMGKDFLENQIVQNEANLEIGTSWADLTELQHSVSIDEINKIIKGL